MAQILFAVLRNLQLIGVEVFWGSMAEEVRCKRRKSGMSRSSGTFGSEVKGQGRSGTMKGGKTVKVRVQVMNGSNYDQKVRALMD
jgi:hypothetical protein